MNVKPRILVIEDMANLRAYVAETLHDLGEVEVQCANDGAEALGKIDQESPFYLLICDLSMPRMDGETLLAELRKRAHLHLEGHLGVGGVELVDVDALELQPLEAALEVRAQLARLIELARLMM